MLQGWNAVTWVGLPWNAVTLDRAELDIGWQLQRVRRELLHREPSPVPPDATLPLPGICVTALRMREKEQAEARVLAGGNWIESGLVFTTSVGTPFGPRNFNRRFEARRVKAGLGRSRFTMSGAPVRACSRPCASCGMRRSM